jgi:C4-dicarboxylate-binding protein DctP
MKDFVKLVGLIIFTLTMMGCSEQPITIKFSHVTADSTPKGQGALKFKELAEQKFPGRVEIQIFPNSQLFDDDQGMDALLLGDIHFLAPSLSKFDRYTKKLQVYDLPFLFNDSDAVIKFQNSPSGVLLLDAMREKGLQGLAYWLNGMKQLSTNRSQLQQPQDVEGLKFRIQESDVLQAQFRALDANPQKMAFSEVYQALQTGVVDGQENTWSNIYTQKYHEVQDVIAETNHGIILYMVITNAAWWDDLPEDIRTGLADAMAQATDYANKLSNEINLRDRGQIAAAGRARIQTLTPQDITAWRSAMAPVWQEYESEIGKDLIDAALSANN